MKTRAGTVSLLILLSNTFSLTTYLLKSLQENMTKAATFGPRESFYILCCVGIHHFTETQTERFWTRLSRLRLILTALSGLVCSRVRRIS